LLAQIEAKKQRQSQLTELDTLTDSTLGQLGHIVSKIGDYAPSAIASLKSAVLTLFDSGDNGNDGGNQPTNPTPQPDDDEPELKSLNGETGDCLTTADPLNKPHPHKAELDGRAYEWATPFASPLTCLLWEDAQRLGQHCQLTSHWEHDWELEPLDGQAWEIATPLCCLLSNAPKHNEDKGTDKAEYRAYIELVSHPENKAIAYQRKHDGEIICTYIGFRTKAIAQSWIHYVEAITSGVELRSSKQMLGFKWEMKIKGMSVRQIERLAKEDLTKTYRPEIGSTKPPTEKPQPIPQPVNPDEVGEGDIVTQLLTRSASYKVIQVMPNGILDCENTTTGLRLGLRPAAVSLVQKANTKVPIAECSIVDAPLEQPEPTELTITSAEWEELKKLATDGGLSQEQLGDIALAPYDYQRGSQIKTSQFAEVKRKLERAIANIRIAKENQQMLDGIAATVFDQKFQQQNTRLSMGATHGR
jgi:DNA-binding transcriptional regulator YdaS (Cro superfamily)